MIWWMVFFFQCDANPLQHIPMKNIVTTLAAIAAVTVSAQAAPNVQITEIMYTGLFGEFIELTNIGADPQSFDTPGSIGGTATVGWSFSDSDNVAGEVSLAQIDELSDGESAIITEVSDTIFIQAWYTEPPANPVTLAATNIVENNAVNLGRSDTVNIYDENGNTKDSVVYSDPFGPRSEDVSAKPDATLSAQGTNAAFSTWLLSTTSGAPNGNAWKAGVTGAPGPVGSPGKYPN